MELGLAGGEASILLTDSEKLFGKFASLLSGLFLLGGVLLASLVGLNDEGLGLVLDEFELLYIAVELPSV